MTQLQRILFVGITVVACAAVGMAWSVTTATADQASMVSVAVHCLPGKRDGRTFDNCVVVRGWSTGRTDLCRTGANGGGCQTYWGSGPRPMNTTSVTNPADAVRPRPVR